jgi:predicted aldo/keto reductase-like oxidoreductase
MKLAIGTAQFGMRYGISNVSGKVSLADGEAILKYAASAGIDTIDTAMAYGDSEQVLGNIGLEGFNVVKKLPEIPVLVKMSSLLSLMLLSQIPVKNLKYPKDFRISFNNGRY